MANVISGMSNRRLLATGVSIGVGANVIGTQANNVIGHYTRKMKNSKSVRVKKVANHGVGTNQRQSKNQKGANATEPWVI